MEIEPRHLLSTPTPKVAGPTEAVEPIEEVATILTSTNIKAMKAAKISGDLPIGDDHDFMTEMIMSLWGKLHPSNIKQFINTSIIDYW